MNLDRQFRNDYHKLRERLMYRELFNIMRWVQIPLMQINVD